MAGNITLTTWQAVTPPLTETNLILSPNAGSAAGWRINTSVMKSLPGSDRLAIAVLAAIAQANGLGAYDYRAKHKQLIGDAQVFARGMENFDFLTAHEATMAAIAIASYSLSTDVPTLISNAKDLRQLPEETLFRILSYLRWIGGV